MKLIDYNLKIKNKQLLCNVDISFESGRINHIVGGNGVGKSSFAKSLVGILPYSGEIVVDETPTIIGSYTSVPNDLTTNDIIKFLSKKHGKETTMELVEMLSINSTLDINLRISKLSDGQKQKVKLLSFLIDTPKLIVLDEFTTSLDKKTTLELYEFFNKFVVKNNITCLNITHNLADIEHMNGDYFYFNDQTIKQFSNKEEIIDKYVRGGL